jgi:choline dehydrogenase-like flavoprotein
VIRDLAGVGDAKNEFVADVLVIGAGIAGLLVATHLARVGIKVLVAESGGMTQTGDTHPLNVVEQLGDTYSGAEHGRFRCLGGTSTRWGGAMLPFQKADMEPHGAGWDVEWPIKLSALTAYQDQVERVFHLGNGPYDFSEVLLNPGRGLTWFVARMAKWPAFRNRNIANLLAADIRSQRGPVVWVNATATDFALDPAGRLVSVRLRSSNGNTLSVTAGETLIAAGAIESTRLLLLLDRQHGDRIFAPHNVLGRYFYDHLSLASGRLTNVQRKALNRIVGFRFEGRIMRNLRFEPTADLREKERCPAGFLHIGFTNIEPAGFDVLRNVYRKVQ